MSTKARRVIPFCVVFVLLLSVFTPSMFLLTGRVRAATSYYVKVTGNNGNDGLGALCYFHVVHTNTVLMSGVFNATGYFKNV